MLTEELFDYQLLQLKRSGIVFFEKDSTTKSLLFKILAGLNVILFTIPICVLIHFFINNFYNVVLAAETYSYCFTAIFNFYKMVYIIIKKEEYEKVVENLRILSKSGWFLNLIPETLQTRISGQKSLIVIFSSLNHFRFTL